MIFNDLKSLLEFVDFRGLIFTRTSYSEFMKHDLNNTFYFTYYGFFQKFRLQVFFSP